MVKGRLARKARAGLCGILGIASFFTAWGPSAKAAEGELYAESGWEGIPAEEVAAEKPMVDPDAHVEILYRAIYQDDSDLDSTYSDHHTRVKVYTLEGVEELDKIDIFYPKATAISKLEARIIYPDGTVRHLSPEDFHSRKLYEFEEFKGHAMSFSPPMLSPGTIIDYKWTEFRRHRSDTLQRRLLSDWPTLKFKLVVNPPMNMASRIVAYNGFCTIEKKLGLFHAEAGMLPARFEYPHMPPWKDFEPFINIECGWDTRDLRPENYWENRAEYLYDRNKESWSTPDSKWVKSLADEIFEGVSDPEENLRRAYEYCTTKLINTSVDTDAYTKQERENLKRNENVYHVIKRGYGSDLDINALFTSLAGNAGYEAWVVMVEDREENSFDIEKVGRLSPRTRIVAVKAGDGWRYFDPGGHLLPFEVLAPENTSAKVLMPGKDAVNWNWTNEPSRDFTKTARIATLVLDEDGNLEGDIELTYYGYEALKRRRLFLEKTNEEIEEYYEEGVWQARCPQALVTGVAVDNLEDREKELEVSFHIELPGFAELAGDRLLLNPSVFEKGSLPVFKDPDRKLPVNFSHSFRVYDFVRIQLPESMVLETQELGDVGFAGAVLNRNSGMVYDAEANTVTFKRLLQLDKSLFNRYFELEGNEVRMAGPPYSLVKAEFDALNQIEAQSVSLIRKETLPREDPHVSN